MMLSDNPLLDFNGFPLFEEIRPEHVEPAIDDVLARNREAIRGLEQRAADPDWDSVIAPLEEMDNELERVWSPVSHLNGVRDSESLRQAYEACLPKLSEYAAELGQNAVLFDRFSRIRQRDDFADMDVARRKVVENGLRDFRLAGVELGAEDQAQYRVLTSELSRLSNLFSRNVLDATDGWTLHLEDEADLGGLPPTVIDGASERARQEGLQGWVFTLQAPSYVPFMTYADNGVLREKMYRAYVTRASETGPRGGQWDNGPLMLEILELRNKLAVLLGFDDYAAYSVTTKMAQSAQQIEDFLADLAASAKPFAEREYAELQAFAREFDGATELQAWDIAWYSEKLRQRLHDFSQEDLRPYFPVPGVIKGMFEIVHRLFGITISPAKPPQRWHDEVTFYRVKNADGELCGHFYMDLYARQKKRGGAWMADCAGRFRHDHDIQLPLAFLTCNFTAPVDDRPSLLTHEEVMTLFHEFGHGLHHLLTRVEVLGVSGINGVPWDAVELPSQFLENWCWEREALNLFSGHVDSGETLPDVMLGKMKGARNFQSAMQMMRQIEFSLFDLRIHHGFDPGGEATIQDVLDGVREEVAVIVPPRFNRFQNSFGHIFAGGYAAGYYSYKWAEVLSADAFSLFEEKGIFDTDCGKSFLENILEKGGSEDPMTLFTRFRGRKPGVEALLRHSGLSLTT